MYVLQDGGGQLKGVISFSLGVVPIGVVLTILAAVTGSPPDLTGIAALVTAAVGVIGFIVTLVRGRANNKRVEEVEQAASYVKGFEALVARLQDEINVLRDESSVLRQKQQANMAEFENAIGGLQITLRETEAALRSKEGELAQLRGEVRGFLSADEYESFQSHSERLSGR
jgi:hypothetical protein